MEEELSKKLERKITNILKDHQLSNTKPRRLVLAYFYMANKALNHHDIEKAAKNILDRVTIYRTLQVLLKHHLIHNVPNNGTTVLYALCKHSHNFDDDSPSIIHDHIDNHIHFSCAKCNSVTCLNEVEIPAVVLPKQYKMFGAQLLMHGVCNKCN
jgi:Fur family transcriptional regulator, ferric uptake regulator